jgi:Mrp family chromosome partitioning ATPase
VALEEALVPTRYGENLRLLLADYEGDTIAEMFSFSAAIRLLDDARQLADYVIIDSPPLTDVVDSLPLAKEADQVLIVSRLGNARLAKLQQLGEQLAESGIRPAGFVLVGTPRPRRREDHYYHERRSSAASRKSGFRRRETVRTP